MDSERAKLATEAVKSVQKLGTNLKTALESSTSLSKISGPTEITPSGLPVPIAGSGLIGTLMYIVAGILVIGLILLVIDYWFFPIFQKTPGGAGYVMIPGTDRSDVFWEDIRRVRNITIGTPTTDDSTGQTADMYTSIIEGQSNYSITLDVLISDEYPQNFGDTAKSMEQKRVFFAIGASVNTPSMTFSIDNHKNTAYINVYDKNARVQTAVIDNVPIHKSFRLGLVKTPYAMEGYLNGALVKTIQLRSSYVDPTKGDTIFAPANITIGTDSPVNLSKGIKAMKLRLFGDAIQPAEMKARMSDLSSVSEFIPASRAKLG
jgi:hypothetical protein